MTTAGRLLAVLAFILGAFTLITTAETADLVGQRTKQMQAQKGASGMPREAVQGHPVPVMRGGELSLAFLYFLRSGKPPAPPKITAPGWIGYIDVASGAKAEFVELERGPGEPIGEHKLPPGMGMAEYRAAEQQLHAALARLLDMARNPARPLSPEEAAAASEFRRLWKSLSHKPLARYYRSLNPEWFAAIKLR